MSSTRQQEILEQATRVSESLIAACDVSIYTPIDNLGSLYYSREELEILLNDRLKGLNLDFPLRTRSKVIKTAVCRALGYPSPSSFKKVRPRFKGQNFDVYVQKSNNLQIWNEDVSPDRRYIFVKPDDKNIVIKVRVVLGTQIASLDTTGKLTSKHQAKAASQPHGAVLVSQTDTTHLIGKIQKGILGGEKGRGIPAYTRPDFFTIQQLYAKLSKLIGLEFQDPGRDQERNRGALLHELVQLTLGMDAYSDNGQIPDVPSQLLEIKLQTSPTIDLGLFPPSDTGAMPELGGARYCDLRYAIFYGNTDGSRVIITGLVICTGADFFTFFNKFGGLGVNKKIQIHLPRDFID